MENSPCVLETFDTHLFLMQLPVSPSAGFRINALSKKKKKELDFDSIFSLWLIEVIDILDIYLNAE